MNETFNDIVTPIETEALREPTRHVTPSEGRLARCNMRRQEFGALYSPETALRNGTVFPELNMPYRWGNNPNSGGN
ncbi:MAG: spore coat associated protein CotJA [Defluviitaleaceae bacterium]|nr:spore coat associated protein CotJA [Defluviitaleaceae bacterium]